MSFVHWHQSFKVTNFSHYDMTKLLVSLLILLCITSWFLWFYSPKAKNFIEVNGPLFSIIATLGGLAVFIQFYSEVEKSSRENQEKRQEEKAKLNSKMVALGSEIVNNIQLCNLFESEKDSNLKGVEVPNVLFCGFRFEVQFPALERIGWG